MIRSALILALLLPLGGQYAPTRPHPTLGTVFNPCLVSGWPMDDGSGTVLRDVSGNANTANAAAGGTFTWQSNAGFPGTTILWPATTATATKATSTTLTNFDGTTPFSVAVWMKTTSTAEQIFAGTMQPGQYQGWEIGSNTAGASKLDFIVSNTFGSNAIVVHGSTTILNNGRHFLVGTYDGSRTAAGVKLYVDGSAETVTVDQNSLTATAANGRPTAIATRILDGELVQGNEAFLAVYNCVLTSTQVSTYNGLGPQIN